MNKTNSGFIIFAIFIAVFIASISISKSLNYFTLTTGGFSGFKDFGRTSLDAGFRDYIIKSLIAPTPGSSFVITNSEYSDYVYGPFPSNQSDIDIYTDFNYLNLSRYPEVVVDNISIAGDYSSVKSKRILKNMETEGGISTGSIAYDFKTDSTRMKSESVGTEKVGDAKIVNALEQTESIDVKGHVQELKYEKEASGIRSEGLLRKIKASKDTVYIDVKADIHEVEYEKQQLSNIDQTSENRFLETELQDFFLKIGTGTIQLNLIYDLLASVWKDKEISVRTFFRILEEHNLFTRKEVLSYFQQFKENNIEIDVSYASQKDKIEQLNIFIPVNAQNFFEIFSRMKVSQEMILKVLTTSIKIQNIDTSYYSEKFRQYLDTIFQSQVKHQKIKSQTGFDSEGIYNQTDGKIIKRDTEQINIKHTNRKQTLSIISDATKVDSAIKQGKLDYIFTTDALNYKIDRYAPKIVIERDIIPSIGYFGSTFTCHIKVKNMGKTGAVNTTIVEVLDDRVEIISPLTKKNKRIKFNDGKFSSGVRYMAWLITDMIQPFDQKEQVVTFSFQFKVIE